MGRTDSVYIKLYTDHKIQHFLIYIHGRGVDELSEKIYAYSESIFVDLYEHRNVELLPGIIRDAVTHVASQSDYFKAGGYPTDKQLRTCSELLFHGSVQRRNNDGFNWFITKHHDRNTPITHIKHNGSMNLNSTLHILFRYLPFQN